MVEANREIPGGNEAVQNGEGEGANDDQHMIIDEVIKPRSNFSSNALRCAVPRTDLRKKKESLSMSLININGMRQGSRMFSSSSNVVSGEEGGRHQSFNVEIVSRQISFASPRGRDIGIAVKNSSGVVNAVVQENPISEESSGSSEHSDQTSSEGSGDDSSIDAAINGEEETEQSLYNKILAA